MQARSYRFPAAERLRKIRTPMANDGVQGSEECKPLHLRHSAGELKLEAPDMQVPRMCR